MVTSIFATVPAFILSQSAISYRGRTSISLGPGIGLGQCFTQATASSMSLTSQSHNPATNSRLLGNGPLITWRLRPSNPIGLPSEDGFKPSQLPAFMMRALISFSLNCPIASMDARISAVGRNPLSLSLAACTNTMTRISLRLVCALCPL